MTDYKLLYYSPAFDQRVAAEIPARLEDIGRTYGLANEKVALRLLPSAFDHTLLVPDEEHEKEIYYRDLMPRWPILNRRTGVRVSKAFRSNRGHYFVAGKVVVVSDAGVEWYPAGNRFGAYDPHDPSLDFLKALLARGPALLAELFGRK